VVCTLAVATDVQFQSTLIDLFLGWLNSFFFIVADPTSAEVLPRAVSYGQS
jgi:hypothetical protein